MYETNKEKRRRNIGSTGSNAGFQKKHRCWKERAQRNKLMLSRKRQFSKMAKNLR